MLQTETFDAEMEGLASNVKKNKKLPARHGHLEESISRHKQHVTRLEQMLRLLDNEVRQHITQCMYTCPSDTHQGSTGGDRNSVLGIFGRARRGDSGCLLPSAQE